MILTSVSIYLYLIAQSISSELVLRDEDKDLRDGAPDERGVVVDLHAKIQLDLLRPRDRARQHQDRLWRRRSLQSETGLRGARDTRWCAHIHQCHGELYRRIGLVTSSHSKQLELTGGRDGQHAYESDVVVRVMRGRSEATQIVHAAVLWRAYAAAEIREICGFIIGSIK